MIKIENNKLHVSTRVFFKCSKLVLQKPGLFLMHASFYVKWFLAENFIRFNITEEFIKYFRMWHGGNL